ILGEFGEAVAVMLFYQIGELFEEYAVGKSRNSISELMDICPDYANIVRNDGTVESVDAENVHTGEIILVKPGEKVPLDGVLETGKSTLDTKALTGESLPREVSEGDEIFSGCINLTNVIQIRTTREFSESTASKILELVENATSKKASSEKLITKFARYYTPAVVMLAVILAIVPPILSVGSFETWVYRALAFLVVSCPCALVISIPLSFFSGVGAASAAGILVKGSTYLEALAKVETVVFDKTGTITTGDFSVKKVVCMKKPKGVRDEEELLMLAAYAEYYSDHPLAKAIRNFYTARTGKEIDPEIIKDTEEVSGKGVRVALNVGNAERKNCDEAAASDFSGLAEKFGAYVLQVSAGSHDLMSGAEKREFTSVHVSANGDYLGYIELADTVKPDAKSAIYNLRKRGIKNISVLTGDRKKSAERAVSDLNPDNVYAELLPQEKVAITEKLIAEGKGKSKVAFVGDGINDAPVLARADVGIAMGALGSDAAIEAADVVIMDDNLSKIAVLLGISAKTSTIAKENIVFALGVKFLVLALVAAGLANMWAAVFADVGVSIIAILNSMRTLTVSRS
ncbi:MAG: heavy metal translocating P-type ATPase, partial [Clostridia bacterium]|nr:heavy metal translocating P-type ATPase [Clostridia bacterium]